MATASTAFENEEVMHLQASVMLYGNGHGASFATAHNVFFDDKGSPCLLEGHPLTMEILNDMLNAVSKGAESMHSFKGYLPENVLAVGVSSIVWWLPSSDRNVSFKCKDELIGNASGKTPHPALVFSVNNSGNWSVFAIKGNKRPTPETPLWQAPYFNTYGNGNICQGSTIVPKGATADQVEAWNKAFFASSFSHPNVHQPQKLMKYKRGPYQFWRDMLDGSFKKFPQSVLVATEYTLEGFIESTLNGKAL